MGKANRGAARLRGGVKESSARLKDKEEEYSDLLKNTKVQQASANSTEGALNARQAALDARQRKLDGMQTDLKKEIDRLTNDNRELLQTKKEVERREQELTVETLELQTKARGARGAATTPGIKTMDKGDAMAPRPEEVEEEA